MYEMRVCLFSPKIQKFLLKVFHIIKKILILTFFQRGYKKIPLAPPILFPEDDHWRI